MSNFIIFTDSACDLKEEILKKYGIKSIDPTFIFENEDKQYVNSDMTSEEFYCKMKEGKVARTSAINVSTFKDAFEEELKKGNDVLYIGLSSSLSGTYASSRMAAEELGEIYPDRKILAVDSLGASAGQGLLVILAAEKQQEGMNVSETAKFVFDIRLKVHHWFTVNDLVYLKRSGRLSSGTAFVGGVLHVKPVLNADREGKLVSVSKVRGRKNAVKEIIEKYGEYADDISKGRVFISHADCIDDAEELARELKEKYSAEVELITDIGPVVGAHAGPGTLALFFIGKER